MTPGLVAVACPAVLRTIAAMASVLGPELLPPDLRQKLADELRPGEKLSWSAQPRPRAVLRQAFAMLLGGGFFTAFAVFWMAAPFLFDNHAGHRPPVFFTLFGVPFLLIGLGTMTSPLWSQKTAARTVYGLSDQRALIIRPRTFGGWTVQSFMPDRLTSMTRTERADGSGDLIFEQFTERVGTGSRTTRRGFLGIDRVREVEDLIVKTLLAGRVR